MIDTERLAKAAFSAMEQAYAPYSKFFVGAALLMEDETVYTGCNIENASYGMTLCAERVAIVKAVSEGRRDLKAIYIVAESETPWPCGACRQVMHEFAPDMLVYAQHAGGKIHMRTLKDLLPKAFALQK